MINVIVLLKGGGHIPIPVKSAQEAMRLLKHILNAVKGTDQGAVVEGNDERYLFRVKSVIGAYISDGVAPIKRIADAIERESKRGEEWKD